MYFEPYFVGLNAVSMWDFDNLAIEFKYLEDIALNGRERSADLSRGVRRR